MRKLYEAAPNDFEASGLGEDLLQARANMRAIRQRGVAITRGELSVGVTGVAAPIFDSKGVILGSLSVTIGQSVLQPDRVAFVVDRVSFGARIVSKAIARDRESLA